MGNILVGLAVIYILWCWTAGSIIMRHDDKKRSLMQCIYNLFMLPLLIPFIFITRILGLIIGVLSGNNRN